MAEATELDKSIRKNAVTSGLIFGGVSFVLGIFSFYFMTTMATSMMLIIFGPLVFSVILPIVISIFITLDLRKKIGGFWTFRQATSGVFIMFFVSYLLSSIATNFIFAKIIEPDMVQKTETAMVNATTTMMEKNNVDQEKIDKQTAEIEKKFEEQKHPTIGSYFKNIAIAIILIFILSLIYGAIFKKEKPLFDLIDEEPAL